MKQLSPTEFSEWQKSGKDYVLVDVREAWERTLYSIGGLHLPFSEALPGKEAIPMNRPVVVYCEKGIRSGIIIQRLEELGYENLYNLAGGMKAWKEGNP